MLNINNINPAIHLLPRMAPPLRSTEGRLLLVQIPTAAITFAQVDVKPDRKATRSLRNKSPARDQMFNFAKQPVFFAQRRNDFS
jgi:hypothetical protein